MANLEERIKNYNERENFKKQEKLIENCLHLNDDSINSEERITLAKYIVDVECAIYNDDLSLFKASDIQLTPMNQAEFADMMIERSFAIHEMALTTSQEWLFDIIKAFFIDLEKTLTFSDSKYKQNYVLLVKYINQALENQDFIAVSDLFLGEMPALLRSFKQQANQTLK